MKAIQTMKVLSTGLLAAAMLSACAPGGAQVHQTEGQADIASGIIGGRDVDANNPMSKSFVALYDTAKGALCTGTLIGNNLVLTAAHCISENPTTMAVIFMTNLVSGQINKELVRRVDGAIANPSYASNQNNDKNTGDIALVHFQGQLPAGYQAVPLLPAARASLLRKGQLILLAGYGISNGVTKVGSGILRQTSIRIFDERFSQTEVKLDQTQGTGACHGDSGGPAILFIGSQAYVWGVTSRGSEDPNDDCSRYVIYTNAASYQQWIADAGQTLIVRTANAPRQAAPNFQLVMRPRKI